MLVRELSYCNLVLFILFGLGFFFAFLDRFVCLCPHSSQILFCFVFCFFSGRQFSLVCGEIVMIFSLAHFVTTPSWEKIEKCGKEILLIVGNGYDIAKQS